MGVEVKADEKSKYTGNLVVEIEFNGKPSALSTTTAAWWVFYDGECYIWITPEKLEEVATEYGYLAQFIGKGDVKSKKAYLVRKSIVKKHSNLINYC